MEIVKRANVKFGTGFGGPIEISADAFDDGTVLLAIKSSNSSVYSTIALGPAQTARDLAAALTAAADAVDPPKKAEPTVEQQISDARQAGYEEGYKDATSEHEENS